MIPISHNISVEKSQENVLLVQIDPPCEEFQGDHYYRTYGPLLALGNRSPYFYTVSLTNENRLKQYLAEIADILVLNLLGDIDLWPLLVERKRKKLITIYEWNDDVYNIPPWNPQYRFFAQPLVQRIMEFLAKNSEVVQFSSFVLEDLYKELNPRSVVFFNHFLDIPEKVIDQNNTSLIEIGYGGSAGHLYDAAYIAPALVEWMTGKDNVRLNIMAADEIKSLFRDLPPNKLRTFPTGNIYDYYNFLSKIHIGLAPLQDIPFNRCRSDVKFLEYAAYGVVPVVQKTQPYTQVVKHGETGFVFQNIKEFVIILNKLIDNPSLRCRIADNARKYIKTERMMVDRYKEREGFYISLMRNRSFRNTRKNNTRIFEHIARAEGAVRKGGYILLGPTAFEYHLRRGLYALGDNNFVEARRSFEGAMQVNSNNYLPYLYASMCTAGEERELLLGEALKRNPKSLMVNLLRGDKGGYGKNGL